MKFSIYLNRRVFVMGSFAGMVRIFDMDPETAYSNSRSKSGNILTINTSQ